MSGDRCTGHCCRSLFVPASPAELRENARAERDGNLDRKGRDRNGRFLIKDIAFLFDMLRPNGKKAPGASGHLPMRYGYECRHLRANGDCRSYDNRPDMCAAYPYGQKCTREGCTWTAAKEGRA